METTDRTATQWQVKMDEMAAKSNALRKDCTNIQEIHNTPEEQSMNDEAQLGAIFVLNHGNNGSPEDWDKFAAILKERHSSRFRNKRIEILQASANSSDTHGGIPLLGNLLADEIEKFLNEIETDKKGVTFNIIGHSLVE